MQYQGFHALLLTKIPQKSHKFRTKSPKTSIIHRKKKLLITPNTANQNLPFKSDESTHSIHTRFPPSHLSFHDYNLFYKLIMHKISINYQTLPFPETRHKKNCNDRNKSWALVHLWNSTQTHSHTQDIEKLWIAKTWREKSQQCLNWKAISGNHL